MITFSAHFDKRTVSFNMDKPSRPPGWETLVYRLYVRMPQSTCLLLTHICKKNYATKGDASCSHHTEEKERLELLLGQVILNVLEESKGLY